MQAKAQLDALKRFIMSMESEIVEKKRIAQDQRQLNGNFDGRVQRENSKRARDQKIMQSENREQHSMKTSLEKMRKTQDREVPDIAGNEGYPRIYQRNQKEERAKTIKENAFMASELNKQMAAKKAQKDKLEAEEAEVDRTYLSGWGYRKDATEPSQYFATSGNLGKMAGPNRQDHLNKVRDVQ